ncbi:Eco57I restriction-modification methylase domain-containing protein [Actinomyces bowdenii]|uniref:site-specific DNA-methyltransferase (adenine-specific) n=1 Tax=Actinomyces bowdenii TaxID=131109 RepID=A0A3P1ULQ8_9ACTO|nr:class I SAM-dependent DNA methyltransferase [Actinomyces bowdenii]RRD22558.1 class I SAM-dependent DNA methyltransferase [Actinomyces bowdenii]
MAVSDALVVGEDWISEHYFTSQAAKGSFAARVLERRQEWAEAEAEGVATSRSRFRAQRSRLESLLAELPAPEGAPGQDPGALGAAGLGATAPAALAGGAPDGPGERAAEELDGLLREVLGYSTGEFGLWECGPVTLVRPVGVEGPAPAALVRARPAATVEDLLVKDAPSLAAPWVPVDLADPASGPLEGAEPVVSVSRALSVLMTDEHGPAFALVLAGRWALVVERERWPEGRWLAVDVQLVAERSELTRGGEVERALACLEARSLLPTAQGETWWSTTLEDSAAHTVGVSKDLREGVRLSVEILANEVVRRRVARGLEPLEQGQAQPLALQCLRYLYRIIFLLYAEASPELGVLPVGAQEYDAGYGLDRLRELVLRELHEESSRSGTHVYESSELLFALVDQGRNADAGSAGGAGGPRGAAAPAADEAEGPGAAAGPWPGDEEAEPFSGLVFQPMRADLFRPASTALIDEVGLGNEAMLRVLRHLLLTRGESGAGRGFISYVELGINQLGAVYEGLMSYTGSFATERLWEVAPGGDASKGSWVVPREVAEGLSDADMVTRVDEVTGERRSVIHEPGTFVFRLSGRDRQRSASYYTPEVLTRFTVQQALAELLDQDGRVTTAREVLGLSVCEPALGSGAFAIEAVRQLAEQYLSRRERELGRRVDPEQRPRELAKVKAFIALHRVYGVDLNATAVELAEVSLWLDTMVEGLSAPWFGLRLRRGNSLVGAKRALYDVAALRKRAWLSTAPVPEPLSRVGGALDAAGPDAVRRVGSAVEVSHRIHHFLLPASGWGSAVEVPKQVRDLVDAAHLKALKAWRRSVTKAPTAAQARRLTALAARVEVLWEMTLRRLRIAEAEASRRIELWGAEEEAPASRVSREQIEDFLADESSAYRRLRLVMDAWCALWFWPLNRPEVAPPGLEEWIGALEGVLGTGGKANRLVPAGAASLADAGSWDELEVAERTEIQFSGALRVSEVRRAHPWLGVVEEVAAQQGFFHWELDFAPVFARGGFDLQVGNPPWVRPNVELDHLLAEGDPWWVLTTKPSVTEKTARLSSTLNRPGVRDVVLSAATETQVLGEFISDTTAYPVMEGRPDLYRAFMCAVWEHQAPQGVSGLIHMESHFTDAKTPGLRAATYRRLRRHWQFGNDLLLFDVDNHIRYGVHVYGAEHHPSFLHATSLYHPDTVLRSLAHVGSGEEPGFKDPHTGRWDLRPHASRIQRVTRETLQTWQSVTQAKEWQSTPMVYTVNSAAARTLATLAKSPRLAGVGLQFSSGWNETTDFTKGRFVKDWGAASWEDAILQGPHLHVSTPLYKQPNSTMRSNKDWTSVDVEALPPNAEPVTAYKPAGDRATYDRLYTHWQGRPSTDFYRVAWRQMAANTGERTLIPSIIPPAPTYMFTIHAASTETKQIPLVAGTASSILADFTIRSSPKAHILPPSFARISSLDSHHPLASRVVLRVLRLNCLTEAYADLWESCWEDGFAEDVPILPRHDERPVGPLWSPGVPLRRAEDRRNAQVEIDVMVAVMLGVPVEDLCTIYRTQFAVLYDYDHGRGQGAYVYDANGRQVPTPVRKAWEKRERPASDADMPLDERTHTHPGSGISYVYSLPFHTRDRESDFRRIHSTLSVNRTSSRPPWHTNRRSTIK